MPFPDARALSCALQLHRFMFQAGGLFTFLAVLVKPDPGLLWIMLVGRLAGGVIVDRTMGTPCARDEDGGGTEVELLR